MPSLSRRFAGCRVNSRPYLRSVLEQTKNPARLALLLIALAIALQTAPLTHDAKTLIVRLLVLGTICLSAGSR